MITLYHGSNMNIELTYRRFNLQYFFGTELSISKLQKL